MTRTPDKHKSASGAKAPNKPASGQRVWGFLTRSVRPIQPASRETLVQALLDGPSPIVERPSSPKTAKIAAPPPPPPTPPAPVRASTAPLHDRGGERRVRRGKLEIDAKLDLHGYTQEKAEAALRRFLIATQEEGGGVALVVTGKGGRLVSGETAPGVLKRRLPDWLSKPDLRPIVASFAQAHQRHGGAGAYYVFLRRKRLDTD